MKELTINNTVLNPILKHMKDVIDEKSLLAVLQNVLIQVKTDNTATLVVSDLEVTILTRIACETATDQDFEFLFPFSMLFKFCALAGDTDIAFAISKSGSTSITAGSDRLEVKEGLNINDFPKLPLFDDKVTVANISKDFIQAMNMAAISVSKDTLRPAMTKVLLDITENKISVVSTDAHCLFVKEFPSELTEADQLLIGRKAIKALSSFGDTKLSWTSSFISLECDNTRILTRNLSDRFPAYRSIIPDYKPNVSFVTDHLRAAIEKAGITVDQSTCKATFKLKVKDGRIIIHSRNLEDMESSVEIEAEYTGTVDNVGISTKLLSRVLSQVRYEKVQFAIESAQRAILVTSEEDPAYLGLLMPMTIQ